MKLSYITKIALVAVGLLCLGSVVLYFLTASPKKIGGATDETHCPDCGRELPPYAQKSGECPFCKMEILAGKRSPKQAGGNSPVVMLVLVALFVVLLGVHVFAVVRNRKKQAAEEPSYPLFCPKCHRKLRYRHSQGGRLGQCPMCKRPIPFPKPPQPRKRPWPVRVWKQVMG